MITATPGSLLDYVVNLDAGTPCGRGWEGTKPGCKRAKKGTIPPSAPSDSKGKSRRNAPGGSKNQKPTAQDVAKSKKSSSAQLEDLKKSLENRKKQEKPKAVETSQSVATRQKAKKEPQSAPPKKSDLKPEDLVRESALGGFKVVKPPEKMIQDMLPGVTIAQVDPGYVTGMATGSAKTRKEAVAKAKQATDMIDYLKSSPSESFLSAAEKKLRSGPPIKSEKDFEAAIKEAAKVGASSGDPYPVYKARRSLGDRVSRADFDKYLLNLQANDRLSVGGGSVEDTDPYKILDSVATRASGVRTHIQFGG